ncbi:uncharacterized protein TM35_000271970 [Trypanosoma theileri]|uniref:Glycosyltransferase n=1 Tax=Trypanosoma theileri TaxID=67003 RepID=A0A1X0NPJ5_9TRYP|nr:uncharacterized protein TM35_000271970 [Trypanosoma theileri]ORC86607.1 hypothetical protein TM35_000271970 [Trypanosoma theileri]
MITGKLCLQTTLAVVMFISTFWLFAVDRESFILRDDEKSMRMKTKSTVSFSTMDENSMEWDDTDAYSSLYCVGHRLIDYDNNNNNNNSSNNNNNNNNNKDAEAVRIDVISNGLFISNFTHSSQLMEKDVMGSPDKYYFPIYNRTCLYTFVYFDQKKNKFYFYLQNTSFHRKLLAEGKLHLPPVSLSSRPLEIPRARASALRRQSHWAFQYSPIIILGKRPRDAVMDSLLLHKEGEKEENEKDGPNSFSTVYHHNILVTYFLPTVAPWNFAHTLLCDLFGFFWGSMELQKVFKHIYPSEMKFLQNALPDAQIIAASFRYFPKFPLPNSNKAFSFFSHRPALYDVRLPSGLYRALLAGTGTKSWSWVTAKYTASGSPALWFAFRHYIIQLTGAQVEEERKEEKKKKEEEETLLLSSSSSFFKNYSSSFSNTSRPIRVSICYKKDKRGIVNSEELLQFLHHQYSQSSQVEILLESIVGHSAKEQVEMMLATDIFICNEGTLATTFFLMNPGSVFIALPIIYHSPHLHQPHMPSPEKWWSNPDIIRVDPRFNTGGNIDWFPPAIPWIRTIWYHPISLAEVEIQQPLQGLRNYMPDYNIRIDMQRFFLLLKRAIVFIKSRGSLWNIRQCSNLSLDLNRVTTRSYMEKQKNTSFEEEYHYIDICLKPKNWSNVLNNISLRSIFYLHESTAEQDRFRGRTHRPPNYSITGDQCRRLLHLQPSLVTSFNTALCRYGMSWLCEFFVNGRYPQRFFHDKWRLSNGHCGKEESWPVYWQQHLNLLTTTVKTRANKESTHVSEMEGISALDDLHEAVDYFFDVRELQNISQFLFFTKEELLTRYTTTDLGPRFTAEEEIVRKLFG